MGSDTDIVIASAKAYIHAINLMITSSDKQHPQGDV
jgi:2-isopropylmalate synthase